MIVTFYKYYSLSCFLFLYLSSVFLQAQDKKNISDIEKVYLHTDRSTYFVGEDLWYKAYNVRASNNLLFDNSNILYVELISADSKIIARNKTNLELGLGHGDFQLQDSLGVKPGVYQLRAYTNWNRNFGDDFVFKKDIEIIDVFEADSKPNSIQNVITENKIKTKNSKASKESNFKVDFFPEGGSLLENVASVVGFKAVDNNGSPIDCKGEIYNSDNELVTAFESVHDGMGKFQMLSIGGKKYYAIIKTAGTEIRQDLPNVLKQGYLVSFRTFKGKNIVSINTNEATLAQNPNAVLTVVCKAKGISYLETTQTLTETSLSFELPKDKTPEGISQITLLDNTNKPQSERLIFIEKEQDLDIQLLTDKPSYQPNEKAIVSVSSKSKTGAAKSASFSLSVTDMNRQVEEKDFNSNICFYFLMESDIRGKVYHPGYYFDTTNPKRLEHLDNLLLTQGWRDFLWKTIPKSDVKVSYKTEKGITISGRVKQVFADKPLINNNITLALMSKKNRNIFSTVTDSIGRFQFENLMFSGKTNMYLNTRDEKGKFRGEIVLDSIELAPILVKLKKELIVLSETNEVAENVFKKFIAFGVKPENILKEVLVTATTKKKDDMVANYGNYGFADNTYVADEDTHLFTTIGELIQQKIPRSEGVDIYIVDGRRIYPDEKLVLFDVIQPSDVERIDIVRGAQATLFFGEEGERGIIAIYTKPNTGSNKPKKAPFQSIKKEIDGFYTARTFYSPDPEKPNLELDKKAALRNTIYWNPYVHPDKTGNVTVNYYNTKVETKVKVALEGITGGGIPVVKNAFYTVKKQENLK